MIRYTLKCDQGHHFESWFRSAAAFDVLQTAGHLSCPKCASSDIQKSLMAPPVNLASASQPAPPQPPAEQDSAPQNTDPQTIPALEASLKSSSSQTPSEPSPPTLTPQDTEAAIAKMRAHVESSSDYVGKDFASEARKMSDGDTPARSIYGEAKLEDAKALIEDGVPVIPLPFAPKRKLN